MAAGTSAERDTVIWCAACGVPYAPGTPYCGACRQPLDLGAGADPPVLSAPHPGSAAAALAAALRAEYVGPEVPLASEDVAVRPVRPRGVLGRRIARRPRPLTEGEIEALAAAIVAQARAEELSGADASPRPGAPVAAPNPAREASSLAALEFLPPLRERDRQWLAAGLVCCVVLIICAALFVRFLAG